MLKWFEYQSLNQRQPDYVPGSSSSAVCNINKHMHQVFKVIFDLYDENVRVTRKIEKVFSRDCQYVNSLSPNVPEIGREILENWVYDPRFDLLLDRPSHEVVYFHEQSDRDMLLSKFCESMLIDRVKLKPGMGSVKLHVQHPGQIFPLHFDRPQHSDFGEKVHTIDSRPTHTRFLVFMEDQRPGQAFQMDSDYITWKQGDVFTWDARNTMHGSSNLGFWPRFMLMFTLQMG
jgi:hypothetical protein